MISCYFIYYEAALVGIVFFGSSQWKCHTLGGDWFLLIKVRREEWELSGKSVIRCKSMRSCLAVFLVLYSCQRFLCCRFSSLFGIDNSLWGIDSCNIIPGVSIIVTMYVMQFIRQWTEVWQLLLNDLNCARLLPRLVPKFGSEKTIFINYHLLNKETNNETDIFILYS